MYFFILFCSGTYEKRKKKFFFFLKGKKKMSQRPSLSQKVHKQQRRSPALATAASFERVPDGTGVVVIDVKHSKVAESNEQNAIENDNDDYGDNDSDEDEEHGLSVSQKSRN